MALQIGLLETSFQAIAPRGEAFVTDFYERLFTRFPSLTEAYIPLRDQCDRERA